jgi:flotillin
MGDFLGNILVPGAIVIVGIVLVVALYFVATRFKKFPPTTVGVFFGRQYSYTDRDGKKQTRGFKVVSGGGRMLIPLFEDFMDLPTSVFQVTIDEPGIPNKDNVKIDVKGVATCKISTLEDDLINAAEAFLGKKPEEIKEIIENILKGHLRSIIGKMDIDSLLRKRDEFNQQVLAESGTELSKLGVKILTLVIQDINDKEKYIESLGRRAVAEALRDADVNVAAAQREAAIQVSNAKRDAEIIAAENAAKVAQANKERDVQIADMKVTVEIAQAKAERAREIETAAQEKVLQVAQAQRDAATREAQVKVQEQEVLRKEKELQATVVKPAEAARQKQIIDAEAAKQQKLIEAEATALSLQREAEGQKQADTLKGDGEAAKTRATKLAEAAGEQAKLVAEAEGEKAKLLAQAAGKTADAEATEKLAKAMKELDERGALLLILKAAPELIDKLGLAGSQVMEAIFKNAASPLGSVDKITITDLGGDGKPVQGFANVVPNFVVEVLKKLGTMGVDLGDLLKKFGVDPSKFEELLGQAPKQDGKD